MAGVAVVDDIFYYYRQPIDRDGEMELYLTTENTKLHP
jgi:hypothetical protein